MVPSYAGASRVGRKPLDVVLVMDSSGSMKRTDPGKLRHQAAKLFVSLLDADDRVAVVSFEESATLLVPFLRTRDDGERRRLLAGIDRVRSNGPWTDIAAGLGRALEIHQAENGVGQERIVILMTDGRVDTGHAERDAETTTALRGELADAFRRERISLFSLAFTEASDVQLLEDIAFKTGGYMALAKTSDALNEVFIQFFEKLKQPESAPVKGNAFRIDATVREATLIARKTDPDVNVALIRPDGRAVDRYGEGTDFVRFQTETYDLITLRRPETGAWGIRFSHGSGNRVVLITDLKLRSSFDASFLSKDMRVPMEVYLTRAGELLDDPELIDSTLFSLVRVGPGADEAETTELFDDGRDGDTDAGDAVFSGGFEVPGPGSYKLEIRAEGKTFARSRHIAFRATDWWFVPKLAYRADADGAVVDLELDQRFDKVSIEDVEIEAGLRSGRDEKKLSFARADTGYRAALDAPLQPGDYEVALRIRPVVDGDAFFWIDYGGRPISVEADPNAPAGAAQEAVPVEPEHAGGWFRAVLYLAGGNIVVGLIVFTALLIMKKRRLRRLQVEADAEA